MRSSSSYRLVSAALRRSSYSAIVSYPHRHQQHPYEHTTAHLTHLTCPPELVDVPAKLPPLLLELRRHFLQTRLQQRDLRVLRLQHRRALALLALARLDRLLQLHDQRFPILQLALCVPQPRLPICTRLLDVPRRLLRRALQRLDLRLALSHCPLRSARDGLEL